MSDKRACSGTTKAGNPCRARPLKDGDTCLAHADKKTRDETNFQVGGGRPRNPRVVDVMRERVEANIDRVIAPYFDALGVEDIFTRMTGADKLLDRSYGKPRQVQEITGEDGGPVRITEEAFADPETRKALRDAARKVADRAVGPGGPGDAD